MKIKLSDSNIKMYLLVFLTISIGYILILLIKDTKVTSAIIGAEVAIISILINVKNQKEIENLRYKLSKDKALSDARLQYEFEAKKKLYQEYEPLLFQLLENSERALHRVQSLARTSREGEINKDGWLDGTKNYYLKSTIYKLFLPLAIFKLMQNKLTLVDIRLDPKIGRYYQLAKQLYLSYTDDFEFARTIINIEYDPNNSEWQKLRSTKPIKYWRQGLPIGNLDKVLEIFIEKDNNQRKLISYGEFERKISDQNSYAATQINSVEDLFFKFNPETRPILWRILITQASLFNILLQFQNKDKSKSQTIDPSLLISQDDYDKFKWKEDLNDTDLSQPFQVAKEYLSKGSKVNIYQ